MARTFEGGLSGAAFRIAVAGDREVHDLGPFVAAQPGQCFGRQTGETLRSGLGAGPSPLRGVSLGRRPRRSPTNTRCAAAATLGGSGTLSIDGAVTFANGGVLALTAVNEGTVTTGNGRSLVEVDREGALLWSAGPKELPELGLARLAIGRLAE